MAARDPFTSHLMPHVAKIILIRHGEKNRNKDGEESGTGLSTAGKERAQCLVSRFADLGITNLFAFDNKPTTRYCIYMPLFPLPLLYVKYTAFHSTFICRIRYICHYTSFLHGFACHICSFTCRPRYDTTGHCNVLTQNTVFQTPLCNIHHTFKCFL